MIRAIAVMTSGGDAPGMNAAVRAVVRRALDRGLKVYGVHNGYEGLVEGGDSIEPLEWHSVGGIIHRGGTFLGTARSERFRQPEGRRRAATNMIRRDIDALVVIGGDGSLSGAQVLADEWADHVAAITGKSYGTADDTSTLESSEVSAEAAAEAGRREPAPKLNVIGLPGSIDNDLYGTDMCIGADTALNHIIRAMDDLSSTAASHQRTFVMETMGRHCGYLALMAGLGGGASWVLVPEEEMEMRWHRKMTDAIRLARDTGRPHQMVVAAEGARHADGLPIRSDEVKSLLAERLDIDVRLTVLGHIQRGGSPSAFDRVLATRLGVAAVDFLLESPEGDHQHMLGLIKNEVMPTPLNDVVEKSRAVRAEIDSGNYQKAQELRGESFRKSLELVKTLTRITPVHERRHDGAVGLLTGGADSPGMNTAVSVAARCLLNQGIQVMGSRNAFMGLVGGECREIGWDECMMWLSRPGSEIGTARVDLKERDFDRIADTIRKHNLKGLIAIGGWGTYLKVAQLAKLAERREDLRIPILLVPASIDNNLPCTDFCIGTDTALNNIVEAVDKIRHTAGANRRAFIVEVMGRECGFLALTGALASGAEKAYLPEKGISLAELSCDYDNLLAGFRSGKRMTIYLRNEASSHHYTTDFIRRIFEEESKEEFHVRTAILGHIQRGGSPSAFDRILASRMGAFAAFNMMNSLEMEDPGVQVVGLRGRGIQAWPLAEALEEMDLEARRPKDQWFLRLVEVAEILARYAPACRIE